MSAVESNLLAAGPERLISRTAEVVEAADRVLALAKTGVKGKIEAAGGVDAAQHAAHGLAWLATTVEALRQKLEAAAQRSKDLGVLVRGDRSAQFGTSLAVLDACRLAKVTKVDFAALPAGKH